MLSTSHDKCQDEDRTAGGGIWEGLPEEGMPELKCEGLIKIAWQSQWREKGRQRGTRQMDSLVRSHGSSSEHVGGWGTEAQRR